MWAFERMARQQVRAMLPGEELLGEGGSLRHARQSKLAALLTCLGSVTPLVRYTIANGLFPGVREGASHGAVASVHLP